MPKVEVAPAPSVPVIIPLPPPIPQNVIPPPPPIPSAAAPQKPSESKPKVPQSDDSRSSLMQAIRNAGGKKMLRIPAADEQTPTVTKKKPTPAPTGDLMSDLHAKLAMRRRGIAGSKEAKKEKVSLMGKVSSLIPPPSKRSESDDDSNSSDNDWE